MSLTNFTIYARELFDATFDKPQFGIKCGLKVIPLTKNYPTVGSAFDYAMRLIINKHNITLTNAFPLVAERGVKGDKKRKQFIEDFNEKRKLYLNDEIPIKDLLQDCIVLAKIEWLRPITGGNSIWPYPIPFCHLSQSF